MEIIKELLKRAQNNDTNAMIRLGNYSFYTNYDLELALYWYEKALENYDSDALICIARLYREFDILEAEEKTSDDEELQFELSKDTIGWYENALAYYLEDYTENYEHACLAAELVSGVDCFKEDYDLAFKLYDYVANQEADEENQIWIKYAQVRLAKMYRYGLGCESDLELSKKYFIKSNYSKEKFKYILFNRY